VNDCDGVLEGVASSALAGIGVSAWRACVHGKSEQRHRRSFPGETGRARRHADPASADDAGALQHSALLLTRLRLDTRPSKGRRPALPSLFLINTGQDARKTVQAVPPELRVTRLQSAIHRSYTRGPKYLYSCSSFRVPVRSA